jgi:hypothetical protein
MSLTPIDMPSVYLHFDTVQNWLIVVAIVRLSAHNMVFWLVEALCGSPTL